MQSYTRQVREDERPKFGSKNEDNGLNTKDQMSAGWPGIGRSEGELWMTMEFLVGPPAVWWTEDQTSNFSFLSKPDIQSK